MTHKVLNTFYIVPDWFRSLNISNENLLQLLEEVGWINALTINENVYPDLVKIFYSNMDTFAEKENRVITNVGGVLIEFDDTELNSILQTPEDGLKIYSAWKIPTIDNFVHVDVVINICRRIDLSDKVCTIHFHAQCLCLQSRILYRIIQNIILPRSGHLDDVTHMDVFFIDSILRHRPVSFRYTIIRTMLSIPNLISRALPYGNFITQILKYFRVPINEPSCKLCRSIRDKVVYALGFEWRNRAWVKYIEAKYTMFAPSNDRPLNSVAPADQLHDFSLHFRGQRRREDPPTCEPDHDTSASVVPPADPYDSTEVILQQLMDKVRTLSVQQTSF